MRGIKYILIILLVVSILPEELLPQQRITTRGTSTFRKVGVHRGNQVRTVFSNFGVIAQPGNEGPRGAWRYDANGYVGDVSPLVGVQLPIKDYWISTTPPDGIPDTIHSVIITPVDRPGGGESGGGKAYGFEPIPGFANPVIDDVGKGVAMSHQPDTWPPQWPDYPDWTYSGPPIIINGVDVTPQVDWNGYFGRAQFTSDQESYFWMDDYNDEEFNIRNQFVPDTTLPTRTGFGLQVSVRGLQWSNFLAEDVIFWLYNIRNDGTTVYDKAVFGTLVGTYVGVETPEWNDDASFFNVRESITYTWDFDNYISPAANPQWLPEPAAVGYIAYAFLESPGNPFDGVDNDGDDAKFGGAASFFSEGSFSASTVSVGDKLVLIDKNTYARTIYTVPDEDSVNVVSMGVTFTIKPNITELSEGNLRSGTTDVNPNSRDGIDNDLDGLIDENYQVHYRQYKKSATVVLIDTIAPVQYTDFLTGLGENDAMLDEARDDGIDNDNDWNAEFDDVGADGKAGTNDFGENNGIPTAGEPNFDQTDVDESDQIGLTSFEYFVPAGDITMSNDENMWSRLTPGFFEVPSSIVNNVAIRGEDGDFMYGSGYFPLLPGKTERFSLALAFGEDYSDVLKTKRIAQTIYNANYNFPKPPDKPTVKAVAGDGKVTLYWDKVAESSFDPTLKVYDFEGYKIYKGTDPDLTDALTITNGSGQKVFYQPIAQFDLVDDITGYFNSSPTLIELTDAAPFYMGSDNGIQNFYVDDDVINGKVYYYALVAYDKGDPTRDIFPSENTRFISKDALGRISTDQNTVAVVPNAPVLGYVPPESGVMLDRSSGNSSATPMFEVIDPVRIQDRTYYVTFNDSAIYGVDIAYSYNLFYMNENEQPVYIIQNGIMTPDNSDVAEGIRLSFDTTYQSIPNIKMTPYVGDDISEVDINVGLYDSTTGWNQTDLNNLRPNMLQFPVTFPNSKISTDDYLMVFSDAYTDSSNKLPALGPTAPPAKRVNYKVYNISDINNPVRVQFALTESNNYRKDTLSYLDQVIISNPEGTELYWRVQFGGDTSSYVPAGGDSLFLRTTKPFAESDKFVFTTSKAAYDPDGIQDMLDKIKAVPNPYVVSNVYEQPLPPQVRGRGERVIYFTNLPPGSKVNIYTSSGDHVNTLEHDGNLANGSVQWDVRTKEGLDVAYGVYFYVVEIPGISDKKMGKLAIIK